MNISLEHAEVIINGHTCQGWAAEAEAIALPQITLMEEAVGPDGLAVFGSTGMRGGLIEFKFQANSLSKKWFGQQAARIQGGAAIEFNGTIRHRQTGEVTRLGRGAMKNIPAGQTLGNGVPAARQFDIYFQSIVTNYDAMKTDSIPVAA